MADGRANSPGFDPAIKAYYDQAPEESRLELGAFRLEQLRSRELILRHAPEPPATVDVALGEEFPELHVSVVNPGPVDTGFFG